MLARPSKVSGIKGERHLAMFCPGCLSTYHTKFGEAGGGGVLAQETVKNRDSQGSGQAVLGKSVPVT